MVEEEGPYGTSFTNQRTKEHDFLHGIVNQTRHHFIDVSQQPAVIDGMEAEDRGSSYVDKISQLQVEDVLSGLFALPRGMLDTGIKDHEGVTLSLTAAVCSAIGNASIKPADVEFMNECCSAMVGAVKAMEAKDVGKFVLTFDEL